MTIEEFDFSQPGCENSSLFPGCTIPEPGFGALRGDNGSGKTTILESIHARPSLIGGSPNVFLLDQMYAELIYPYKPIWWNIALPALVADGISFADARNLAQHQLDNFGLSITLDRFPDLSGGEMHTVLLARMAVARHEVLLLDEPTAGLDHERYDEFWRVLALLIRGEKRQVLLATHEAPPIGVIQSDVEFQGLNGKQLRLEQYSL